MSADYLNPVSESELAALRSHPSTTDELTRRLVLTIDLRDARVALAENRSFTAQMMTVSVVSGPVAEEYVARDRLSAIAGALRADDPASVERLVATDPIVHALVELGRAIERRSSVDR